MRTIALEGLLRRRRLRRLLVSLRCDSDGRPEMVLTVEGEVPDANGGDAPATPYVFQRL